MKRPKHSRPVLNAKAENAGSSGSRSGAAWASQRSRRGLAVLGVIVIVAVAAVFLYGVADVVLESRCDVGRGCDDLATNYRVESLTYEPNPPSEGCPLIFSSEQCFDLVVTSECTGLPGSWWDLFGNPEVTTTIWVDTTLTVTGPEPFTSTQRVVLGANRCTTVTFDPFYPTAGDYFAEVSFEIVSEWPDPEAEAGEWTLDTAGEECDLAEGPWKAAFVDLWRFDSETGDAYADLGQDNVEGAQFRVLCPCECVTCDPALGLGHVALDLAVSALIDHPTEDNVKTWNVNLTWYECNAPAETLEYQQIIEFENRSTGDVIRLDPTVHPILTGNPDSDSYDLSSLPSGSYEMRVQVSLTLGKECNPAEAVGYDGCEEYEYSAANEVSAIVDR